MQTADKGIGEAKDQTFDIDQQTINKTKQSKRYLDYLTRAYNLI